MLGRHLRLSELSVLVLLKDGASKDSGRKKSVSLAVHICFQNSFKFMEGFNRIRLGHVMQLVRRLTHEPEVQGSIHTFFFPSTNSRRAFVSYWQNYVN